MYVGRADEDIGPYISPSPWHGCVKLQPVGRGDPSRRKLHRTKEERINALFFQTKHYNSY